MTRPALLLVLLLACAVAVLLCVSIGPAGVQLPFSGGDLPLLQLRGPRVLMAAIAGASLAVAGVALQALLRNELAEPYVLGLSGGAAAAAVASLACFPGMPPGPAAACGALGAALLVRGLCRGGYDPTRLLLSGVAVGSVLASVSGLILMLAPQSQLLRSSTYWLFGGIGTPHPVALIAPACVLALSLAWLSARAERLDRLSLGADVAISLGTDVTRLQRVVLLFSVALVAATVAACGLIGFVGLIAPHAARRMVGPGHRALLPVSALLGALLLVVADTFARSAFAPREVPVGLLTALLGGPLFLLQLQRIAPHAGSAGRPDVALPDASGASAKRGAAWLRSAAQLDANPTASERRATSLTCAGQPAANAGLDEPGDASSQPALQCGVARAAAPGGLAPLQSAALGVAPLALQATGLCVGRGEHVVLARVDLAISHGERVALVGENGAGKTSLLRALAGLDPTRGGRLSWRGEPTLPRGPARAAALGVLLQGERAADFSVRELVTLGLGLERPPVAAERVQVQAMLERMQLSALSERPCGALSGGELQRAVLARALVAGPQLLLLDEPTQHLDAARQAALLFTLDQLRGSVAVVISTHDLALAASCDRVLLLHGGAVVAQGAPHAVLTPALLARCLGVMVERRDDPLGGPPSLRVLAPAREVAA